MKFTGLEPAKKEDKSDEIFRYISDERILRVLLELKIFKLREIQKEAIRNGVFFRKSFLVCAPSGSGKTLIGEICAVNNVFQKFGKSIYLVPYKALATEKYVHFNHMDRNPLTPNEYQYQSLRNFNIRRRELL